MARHALLPVACLAVALLLPFLFAAAGVDWMTGIATRVLIFALAGVSLNLILGYGGMVSFGHAAFFGTGAYVVGILSQHAAYGEPLTRWPLELAGTESALIAWPAAMLAAGLLALLVGALSLRTSGLYFIMITLAFAQMVYFFFCRAGHGCLRRGLSCSQSLSAVQALGANFTRVVDTHKSGDMLRLL